MSDQKEVSQWQSRLSKLISQKVDELLDQYLTTYSRPDLIYKIDTLEFDLGSIASDNFEADFIRILEAQLEEKIQQTLRQAEKQAERTAKEFPASLEQFLHFLQTGVLPWWATGQTANTLTDQLSHLIMKQPHLLRRYLPKILEQEMFRRRLSRNFKHTQLVELGTIFLSPSTPEVLSECYQVITNFFHTKVPNSEIEALYWDTVWGAVAWSGQKTLSPKVLLPSLLAQFKRRWPEHQQAFQDSFVAQAAHILSSFANQAPPTIAQKEALLPLDRPMEDKTQARTTNAEIFIDNAGLVVLAPFLPRLFTTLGLLEEKQFRTELDQHRAVNMLHFLLTSEEDPVEFMTPLYKVFCGIELSSSLLTVAMSDAEKAECETFLQSIIAHATVLKNMSVDGFRGSFLLRDGILSARDDHWLVQVERQSYDVVLSQFPWSFEVIKLPWMKRMVMVEW